MVMTPVLGSVTRLIPGPATSGLDTEIGANVPAKYEAGSALVQLGPSIKTTSPVAGTVAVGASTGLIVFAIAYFSFGLGVSS